MYQKSDLRGVPKQDLRWQRFAIGICQNMGILAGNRGKDFLPDLYWLRGIVRRTDAVRAKMGTFFEVLMLASC